MTQESIIYLNSSSDHIKENVWQISLILTVKIIYIVD